MTRKLEILINNYLSGSEDCSSNKRLVQILPTREWLMFRTRADVIGNSKRKKSILSHVVANQLGSIVPQSSIFILCTVMYAAQSYTPHL